MSNFPTKARFYMKAVLMSLLLSFSFQLAALNPLDDPTTAPSPEVDTVELEEQLQLALKVVLYNPDSAMPIFRKLLSQTDDRHMRTRHMIYRGIATVQLSRFKPDSVLVCAEMLQEESERTGYLRGTTYAYMLRGIVNMQLGNDSISLEELSKAEEVALRTKDTLMLSKIMTNTVRPHINLGNEQAALEAMKRSYSLLKNSKNREDVAQAARRLATMHIRRDEVYEAIGLILEALEVFKETGDQHNISACYHSLGNIYQRMSLFNKALDYFEQSSKITEALDLKNDMAMDYYAIAGVYRQLDQFDKALEYALKALELDRQLSRGKILSPHLNLVGIIYLDLQNISEAIKHLEEGIMHERNVGETRQLAQLMANLGRAYYMAQNYAAAIKHAEQALSIAQSLKVNPQAHSALKTLHKCYAALGRHEQAYHASVEMSALKDSISIADEKKAVLQKVYKYEYEKKALADSLAANQEKLELELAYQEELNASSKTRNMLFAAGAILLLAAGGGWGRANLIRKANKRLKEARDRAEESEQFKQRFLANMSHEIRTPMNAVLGMSQLTLDTNLSPKQRSYLEAIKNSSETLLVIVNDILDISKLERKKLVIEHIPFNLREQLNIVYQTLRYKAEEKGLLLQMDVDDRIPQTLIGDPARIKQVMLNLVGNAVKFTEKGEVQIKVKSLPNHRVMFSVNDSGIGIATDKQERLFQVFEQADNSTSRKYGGSGLGLAISKELVELQGGKISFESKENEGSVFFFDLELLPSESEIQPPDATHNPHALRGIRLLVAEDNKYNRIVIIDSLKNLIDEVKIASVENGKEALKALENEQFDLVLMDVHMPLMDGMDATRAIRAQGNNIPIIALTASVLQQDVENCKSSGMNDVLPKPFTREDLISVLGKYYPAREGLV